MADETQVVSDGMGRAVETDAPAEQAPDAFQAYLEGLPDDQRESLEKAGVKGFDHMVRMWEGSENARRSLQSERDQLLSSLTQGADDVEEDFTDVQAPAGIDSFPELDELLPVFGNSESRTIDFIAQTRVNEAVEGLRQEFNAALQQIVGPLYQQSGEAQINDAISQIAAQYPDEWRDLGNRAADIIRSDPSQFNSARGVWAAFGIAKAEADRTGAMRAARQRDADTVEGRGGGGRRQVDAAQSILDRMDAVRPKMDDGMGY